MNKLVLAAVAAISVTTAHAQTYQTYDNGFGNSTTFGPNGQTYQTYDNGFGNSTTFGPNGSSAQTYSNGFGGSTTFVNPGFGRRGW
jgi:hypothetical protein